MDIKFNIENEVENAISNMDETEAVELWNKYCKAINNEERLIELGGLDNFAPFLREKIGCESVDDVFDFAQHEGKGINSSDDYFWRNDYGNWESGNLPITSNEIDDVDVMIEWIEENRDALDNKKIQEAIDIGKGYYQRNENSDLLYVCCSDEHADQLIAINEKAKDANVAIVEDEEYLPDYAEEWAEDGLDCVGVVYEYDKEYAKERKEYIEDNFTDNVSLLSLDEMRKAYENHQEQTKPRDNGLEM